MRRSPADRHSATVSDIVEPSRFVAMVVDSVHPGSAPEAVPATTESITPATHRHIGPRRFGASVDIGISTNVKAIGVVCAIRESFWDWREANRESVAWEHRQSSRPV
jgi:hypothetical protein